MAATETGLDLSEKKRAPLSALRPLMPMVLRHKGLVFAALVALLVASMATLALPVAVRRVIDRGFAGDPAFITTYFLALLAVVGLLALASSFRFYFVITLGERVVADLRQRVFSHLATLDPGFFDTVKSGELVSRLSADTTQLKSAFGASASIALRNLLLFIGASVMMVVTSPLLSALVLSAIPFIVFPLLFSGRQVRRRAQEAQDRLADTSAYAVEALGAVRTMQAFGAESRTSEAYTAAVWNAYAAARDTTRARALLTGVAIFLVSASVVGVLWYGARQVLAGTISGGELSQFVLYAVFAASGLGQLGEVWSEVSAAAGSAQRLADILATRSAIKAPPEPMALPQRVRGEIEFRDVSFAYPARPEEIVVQDLSLHVRAGERVALVGPSGAGKSTVLQLLLRFYDPKTGSLLIDGVPIDRCDPPALRKSMAFVSQDAVVFGMSIAENIAYGRPQATREEIAKAASMAHADGFIAALPQGYDTMLGERGVTLSGGQRQRLAIARAIIKDAPILLLDEATSALDAESEQAVQAALERLMEGRTSIVIAHRLATVLKADRILVMDRGRIVEEGTHASLLRADGLYARLAKLQFDLA